MCHGRAGAEVVRVVFHLDKAMEHNAWLRVAGGDPQPVGQVENDTLEAYFDPWEEPYDLGIAAEDLLTDAGKARLDQLIEAWGEESPDNHVKVLLRTGNAILTVPARAVTKIDVELWRDPPTDPRLQADLN